MFKTIVFSAVAATTITGGAFAFHLVQSLHAQEMAMSQTFATPTGLNSPTFDAQTQQVRANLQAIADDGTRWAVAQQAQH